MYSSTDETLQESKRLDDDFEAMLRSRMADTRQQVGAADSSNTSLYGDYKGDEKEAAYDERHSCSECYEDISRDKWEGAYLCRIYVYYCLTYLTYMYTYTGILQHATQRELFECAICMDLSSQPYDDSDTLAHTSYAPSASSAYSSRGRDVSDIHTSIHMPSSSNSSAIVRPLVLLSCSHIFHQHCMDSFENFCRLLSSSPVRDLSLT